MEKLTEPVSGSFFEIPPLYCPLPSAINPNVQDVERRNIEWMTGLGLCDDPEQRTRLLGCHAADWCCRIAPDGALSGLQIFTDWTSMGLIFDDAHLDRGPTSRRPEELIPILMRMAHALDHPEAQVGDDPFTAGYRNLSQCIREKRSGESSSEWADATTQWWFAAAGLVSYRAASRTPSLADYMVIGPRDRGTRATISFIELAEETSLPPALREAPRVRAVSHATCLLMTIGNDLFSFHRENAENTLESNIVGVLASENRTSLHTALACAVALHDCIMCLFLDLTKALEHNAGEPLKRYLAQLGHLVRGNLEYSLIVPRYNSEVTGISPALLDSIEWAEKPSARRLDAPQIPAIAWLWDQL